MPIDMTTPAVTVLIAAYNKKDCLVRTLRALDRQSWRHFEVILCDDGSAPDLKRAVDDLAAQVSFPLRYVRHDDLGFRKCRILNRGLSLAAADYIIVIDPDCIPHRHFIKGHMEERQPGYYLAGRRLMVGAELSRRIGEGTTDWRQLEHVAGLMLSWLCYGGGRHLEAGLYLPRFLRRLAGRRGAALKGCNMSFWKRDIENINGFEETFEVPCGGEDTDLERRFKAMGLTSISVKHAAVCYHLDHPLLPRDGRADGLCRELADRQIVQALRGLKQQDKEC